MARFAPKHVAWYQRNRQHTVFIDLLDKNPLNLFIFFILLDGLANILAHYPIYIEKWNHNRHKRDQKQRSEYKWDIDYSAFSTWIRKPLEIVKDKLGIGFITFRNIGASDDDLNEVVPFYGISKVSRRILGLATYLSMLYLLLLTVQSVYGNEPGTAIKVWIPISILSLTAYILVECYLSKKALWLIHFAFWSSWIARFYLIYLSFSTGWSPWVAWVFGVLLLLDFFRFSLFKKFRSSFSSYGLFSFYQSVKNHTIYVTTMALAGFLSIAVVIYAHYRFFEVNTLVIIVSYLIIIYGLLVIPIKSFLYHKELSDNRKGIWITPLIKYGTPLLSLIFLIWAGISMKVGNDLHMIPLMNVEDEKDMIDKKEYLDAFCDYFKDDKDTVYFISSYGGGLKANAWNMLILESLTNVNGKNILENTAAMSGVSGGSLGQVFYTAIHKQYKEDSLRRAKIDTISTADFLSIDAAYFLGKDFIREFNISCKSFKSDRAMVSMNNYTRLIGDSTMLEKSFQHYWAELFIEKTKEDNSFYPLILSNSSATHIQRGIASTVDFGDAFDTIFHDAIDILDHDEKSIFYAYGASSSNRFPVFSPVAKIASKGHFLDGGYFENSGLSSLLDLYDYLKKEAGCMPKTVIFLQIV